MGKSRKDLYKQIYKVTYIANINKMINETRYIDILQKISMEGFKTYHIDDFDKLTLHLQSIGLKDSFNISILMHLRDTNYKKMSEIAVLFTDIGDVFAIKKKKMVDRMHNIRKILKRKLDMIKSFKKIEKLSGFAILDGTDKRYEMNYMMKKPENNTRDESEINHHSHIRRRLTKKSDTGYVSQRQVMSKQRIESEWRHYTKSDIIDRLQLLAENHFTLNQLRYMDIDLKYISEIEKMSHIELERYYLTVVNKIDRSLKEWMTICRMYIDIEVNYVECCENMINGSDTCLDLKHFSIDIRSI